MAMLFRAKILTICAFVVYMELYLVKHWDSQLNKDKVDNNFISLMDVTPFLTGKTQSLQKIFGTQKV
jgi:hypothetical protein